MERKIITYSEYFETFYDNQSSELQEKIDWVLEIVKSVEKVSRKIFAYLENTDVIYEIRIEFESNIYRILFFFDKRNLVVLINAFTKKTQKTPLKEITKAEKLKNQYFIDKQIIENEKREKNK